MSNDHYDGGLPDEAVSFIDLVVKKVRYRKKVRCEVRDELVDHFYMAIKDCRTEGERQAAVREVIEEFGDADVVARLIRRGKKRCRPLWRTVFVRSLQVLGVLLLLAGLRIGYLAGGNAVVSVNYVEWLNDYVRQGRKESKNAYPYYVKAVELGDIAVPSSLEAIADGDEQISEENVEEVREYAAKMEGAFEALRQGAGKPYYWPEYEVDDYDYRSDPGLASKVVSEQMPYIGGIKKLARRMSEFDIALKVYDGDVEGAVEECLVLGQFGRHMEGRGLLIGQLVGIAVEGLAFECLENIIHTEVVPARVLEQCRDEMEKLSSDTSSMVDISAEKVFFLDMIQRSFTDDGEGGGRVLLKGLPLAVKDKAGYVTGFVTGGYADRREAVVSVKEFSKNFNEYISIPPYRSKDAAVTAGQEEMLSDAVMSVQLTVPPLVKLREVSWRIMTSRRAMAGIFAVLLYEKDKGEYPVSLQDAVEAGYLNKVPVDPFSGAGFVYRKTEESFILYSFGTDMDDDGGVPYFNGKTGKPRKWGYDSGDTLFWPDVQDL